MTDDNAATPAVRLSDIEGAIDTLEGLPHVRWERVAEVLATFPEEDWDPIYWSLVREWLYMLAGPLEAEYATYESEHFVMLLPFAPREANALLEYAEEMRTRILSFLEAPPEKEYGPHVVILFDDIDDMARYIAPFHPEEGEFRLPPAMMIYGSGYKHIVVHNTSIRNVHQSLVHELVHVMLTQYNLPLWVNEGATQVLSGMVCGSCDHAVDPRIIEMNRNHWTPRNIQRFWSGVLFGAVGRESQLGYSLAVILCKLLAEPDPKVFPVFVTSADAADAGEAAAQECFGMGLGEVLAGFLGEDSWGPDPSIWPETDKEIPEPEPPPHVREEEPDQPQTGEHADIAPVREDPGEAPESLPVLPRVQHKGWFAGAVLLGIVAAALAVTPGASIGIWVAVGFMIAGAVVAGMRSLQP